jgi:hypothetical protein
LFETFGKTTKEDDGKIIKDENEEIITVKFSTYLRLLKSYGGFHVLIILNIVIILG